MSFEEKEMISEGDSTDWQLAKEEVKAALHFKHPPRPPLANSLWHNEETRRVLGEEFGRILQEFPDDVVHAGMGWPYWDAPEDKPDFRWAFGNKKKPENTAIDNMPIIEDWSELKQFLDEMPDPHTPGMENGIKEISRTHPDRYVLVGFGHFFHQRLCYLRGVQNLLFDFLDAPYNLIKIMEALMKYYEVWLERAAAAGADGVWAGDDFGTQRSLFMSPKLFRSLYKPFYKQLVDTAHHLELDLWLHTCGNVTEIMDDFIEIGIDALHPIQVGTMDDTMIVSKYGGKITFWVGMDVQTSYPI